MSKCDKSLAINSIKYYNNIGSYINMFNDANILSQYYKQKTKTIMMRDSIDIRAKDSKSTVRCPKCYMERLQNNSQYKISPKKQKFRFLKNIKKKEESGKLTKYQSKYIKNKEKHIGNQLVIQCNVCQTKVKEILCKPASRRDVLAVPKKSFIECKQQNLYKLEKKKKLQKLKNMKMHKPHKKAAEHRGKLDKFLNTSQSIKSTNLKAFIKSVT